MIPAIFPFQGALVPWLAVVLVDTISSPDTAMIIHIVCVFLVPPYPLFGALYYIERVSTVDVCLNFLLILNLPQKCLDT